VLRFISLGQKKGFFPELFAGWIDINNMVSNYNLKMELVTVTMKRCLLPESWLERVILVSFIVMCAISTVDAMMGRNLGQSSEKLRLSKHQAQEEQVALMALKSKVTTLP